MRQMQYSRQNAIAWYSCQSIDDGWKASDSVLDVLNPTLIEYIWI
jgi:hypothetical protein